MPDGTNGRSDYAATRGARLADVPASGERVTLVEFGTHARRAANHARSAPVTPLRTLLRSVRAYTPVD